MILGNTCLTDVFPSTAIEWQPVESLTGTFQAIHKGLADIMYPGQPPSFYSANGLFVYFAEYKVPSREGGYGGLKDLPVPCLNSLDWSVPDQATLSSFKAKLSDDIQKAMTPGRISRRIRIQWFLPLHVFVACFRSTELQRTKIMWLNRRLNETDLDSVLGDAWKSKESFHLGDTIRCTVNSNSLSISYQINRQSLVLGYDYRRWKRRLGTWVPLDSEENCPEFELEIKVAPFDEPRKLIVTANWTLKDVRQSLEFLDNTTLDYRFKVDGATIRSRHEKEVPSTTCLPPKIVTFGPLA